jgi:uncharacterized membrane protein YdjX (TVP38/TMEM64 family)
MELTGTRQSRARSAEWICACAAVLGLAVLLQALPAAEWVEHIQDYFASLGWRGGFLFVTVYVLAIMTCIPAFVLTIAAGAVYGLGLGGLLVTISINLAGAMAFLVARHLARARIERWLEGSPRIAALDCAIGHGGWRVVALSRLSPLIPFGASNYLFGLTSVRFVPYLVTTAMAMLPISSVYVYLGHVGALSLTARGSRTPAEWALLVAGVVATAVLTIYLTVLGRRNFHACLDRAKRSQRGPRAASDAARKRRAAIAFAVALGVWIAVVVLRAA